MTCSSYDIIIFVTLLMLYTNVCTAILFGTNWEDFPYPVLVIVEIIIGLIVFIVLYEGLING